jgi:ankyrin repeat protein
MKGRRTLQDLVNEAGITPIGLRQPLPAPSQPAIIASEEDHAHARNLLVEQRKSNPDYKDPNKQLKRIFRSSKEKEKLQNPETWEFTQSELDGALSAVIDKPTSSPGLVQAFLSLGAKVNFIESSDKKTKGVKPNVSARRRSTVLQRAATLRRADTVGLLASSGADQTALDDALKAALGANDQSSILELLRHGADVNKFPNALADAVRSNDQNLVRLLLRAPKAFRSEIVSSCLPAAVQAKSEPVLSLLIGYGADPNFNGASALNMAVSTREYRLAVALVAGPVRVNPESLQNVLDPALRIPAGQELYQYLQLLLCCGLPPHSSSLPGLLVTACKRNDTPLARLLIDYGVSTSTNEAECLRSAISHSNWVLIDAILRTPLSSANASVALAILPINSPKAERLQVIGALLQKGASGPPLDRWLIRAVEESDAPLMDLLLHAGAPLASGNGGALQLAIIRKDKQSLRTLLNAKPSPQTLSQAFPLLQQNYSPPERLDVARILLQSGAHGQEVDQALVDAVADTSHSRDAALITELAQHGANVNFDNGKVIQLAAAHADLALLQLLCKSSPSSQSTSAALPHTFATNGRRHPTTLPMMRVLLSNGIEESHASEALRTAVNGGPENLDIIKCLLDADARLLGIAFQYATGLENTHQKAQILRSLLERGIRQDVLDDALATETHHVVSNHDSTVLELLLEHGASVNHKNGEPLAVGVTSGSSVITRLLLNGKEKPSRSTVTKAFRALFKDSSQHYVTAQSGDQSSILSELLQRGVDQPAIDFALRSALDDAYPRNDVESLVDLFLQYRANVNTADGICFVFAARRNDTNTLAKLLAHEPDFNAIVPTMISSKLEEGILIRVLQLFFDHGLTADELEHGGHKSFKKPALVLTLQEYPRSEPLVRLLLTNGCNPDITTYSTVDASINDESVTALVWALTQPQKMVSSSVISALLDSGASSTKSAAISEISPIAIAAREGRQDIVQALLQHGADPSVRDKWNRSALFYASSSSVASMVETLSGYALKDDGSLHEAARSLQLEVATILVKQGHKPNFPSRLHGGRNALGELCLNANVTNGSQRTKARQIIRLFLDNGGNPKFKARNERSAVVLALDNPHSSFEVTEALLETEVWEDLNDEKHMFRDERGLWYSPLKYVELVPSPSRAGNKSGLIELLCDKGCEPKYYSEHAEQPEGAIGMPAPIAKLADRQKEHQLSLKLAQEASEHARMLEEATHRDTLRRKQEEQNAEMAAAAAVQEQWQSLEQGKHEFEMQRVRSAERMKRNEKVAWHNLQKEQELDFAAQRQQIEDRKASATYAQEAKLIQQRQTEVEHRAGVERQALLEKEQLFERNVNRQKQLTDRLDQSAQLHASLRQERPAIEPAKWGSVD